MCKGHTRPLAARQQEGGWGRCSRGGWVCGLRACPCSYLVDVLWGTKLLVAPPPRSAQACTTPKGGEELPPAAAARGRAAGA